MTTIQIRIDAKIKAGAKKVFKKMGLDVSSGIKLYLVRVAQDRELPFTPREFTPTARETKMLRAAEKRFAEGKVIQWRDVKRELANRR